MTAMYPPATLENEEELHEKPSVKAQTDTMRGHDAMTGLMYPQACTVNVNKIS